MTTKKNTVKTASFNLPKTPASWDAVKTASLNKTELESLKGLTELKGFEIWLAPFKTPQKLFRAAPKHEFFVIHIVTWGRKFLARAGKTKVLNIAEIV